MKRVTSDQLADLAFRHPLSEIEVDEAADVQILTLPNGRVCYASLPATPAWVAPEAS